MTRNGAANRRIGSIVLAAACLATAAGVAWTVAGRKAESFAGEAGRGEIAGTLSPAAGSRGTSGLPIPRFVSLKAEKVNVRRGPSSEHAVAWVFQRKGMPVEVVAEFENWRRIRDSDGAEGWILQSMLAGKRTATVAPWRRGEALDLYRAPASSSELVARLGAGVVADISSCSGEWCEISAGGYDGFIAQSMLWGVYPGETVD
jgi:SH3-like domain-containing protein